MSALAFFFIVISLLSFVVAQLILKRAMEFSSANGLGNARFVSLAAIGIALMIWYVLEKASAKWS